MITCVFEKGFKDNLRHVVVHALCVQNNSVLLVKRAGDIPDTGKWGLPGGYMARDENGQDAVLRELYEETGYEGKVINLFRINTNPIRPHEDKQNVVLEYLVKPTKLTGKPDWEQSEVAWVQFDKLLPYNEYAFDHGRSIKILLEYSKSPFPLPIIE
jgi:8-oxo-dGTP diphosphatase